MSQKKIMKTEDKATNRGIDDWLHDTVTRGNRSHGFDADAVVALGRKKTLQCLCCHDRAPAFATDNANRFSPSLAVSTPVS